MTSFFLVSQEMCHPSTVLLQPGTTDKWQCVRMKIIIRALYCFDPSKFKLCWRSVRSQTSCCFIQTGSSIPNQDANNQLHRSSCIQRTAFLCSFEKDLTLDHAHPRVLFSIGNPQVRALWLWLCSALIAYPLDDHSDLCLLTSAALRISAAFSTAARSRSKLA